ncbi:MAG: thioesterase family protein [Lautropia sp.]|nr:thioesterase family protein [Lautropia sp.]
MTDNSNSNSNSLDNYPVQTFDKIRYSDTDRQGHVNNAVFSTFLETGRVEILYDPANELVKDGIEFVIARLTLDYLGEMHWPGNVTIGSRIERLGNSSITLAQVLYQGDKLTAKAETVLVQLDSASRRAKPFDEKARGFFEGMRAGQSNR